MIVHTHKGFPWPFGKIADCPPDPGWLELEAQEEEAGPGQQVGVGAVASAAS